ncbi:ATP-binding protein [Planktothrix paucivesiculata]|uniref:ATPase n=1 Tax=Planktothrix paucivesiculata PCC 9631 TaxID=671071 RepID=A0A7Z9BKH6_9CYAN|nr:AAA family ATPase [Planktothrix paucivesiculata]VXD14585.1 ATPase [Planktothrix paucivesiculata PCC 9631]
MENWLLWDDFLKIVAVDAQLSTKEREIFLVRFLRNNLNKNDQQIADIVYGCDIANSLSNYKKQKTGIYDKLEKICPQIADVNPGEGKFTRVLDWLDEQYTTRKHSSPIQTEPIVNNSSIESALVDNPFIPSNGVIDDDKLFFSRTQEIQRIFETLNSGSSVAIIGERQIGKSSLLMEISRQAQAQLLQAREPIYLNLQEIHDDEDFYQFLCDYAGIDFCKGYRLSRNLQNHRLLLILDELEKMTWDGFTNNIRGQLRGLAEGMNAPLRLIVAACTSLDQLFPDSQDIGMTSPFTGICIEYKLNRWDEQTIRNFIKSRLNLPLLKPEYKTITFTENEISELINKSEGHPQKLMALCNQLFKRYLEELS